MPLNIIGNFDPLLDYVSLKFAIINLSQIKYPRNNNYERLLIVSRLIRNNLVIVIFFTCAWRPLLIF